MTDTRSMLLGAALALLGGVVGAVLVFAIFTATDEDTVPAAQATPTPCENFAALAGPIALVGDGEVLANMMVSTEENTIKALYTRCQDYVNK